MCSPDIDHLCALMQQLEKEEEEEEEKGEEEKEEEEKEEEEKRSKQFVLTSAAGPVTLCTEPA